MRRNGAIGSWDGETGSGVCVRDIQAHAWRGYM